jgi:hypothetical protein
MGRRLRRESKNLVSRTKNKTTKRSVVAEQRTTAHLTKQNDAHEEKAHKAGEAARVWNAFNKKFGSFADEHSTL